MVESSPGEWMKSIGRMECETPPPRNKPLVSLKKAIRGLVD